nr:integrase, catalytic region, zinc finger, CCHC-type, peptidase aspartic, catalytic [Tanacetum cinerariifolium]
MTFLFDFSRLTIVIRDSEETLMLEDESRSKMIQKQKDPMMSKKKVNTKPVDYAALNKLLRDFETRFVPQNELSVKHAFWSQYSMNSEEPNLSSSTTIVEVPNELPKVSMVNSSLKKLKFHLASFDVVVKERTTATTITEELTEVQNVFNQIEQAVEQHCVEKNKFQDKMNDVLKENKRLLEQAISVDIVNIVVHANVNSAYKTVNECERHVTIETELQKDFINKECYDTLFKQYTILEKHCISLEVDSQLKHEIFQRNNLFSQQSDPTFDQLFEINDLKTQSQEKDTVIMKLKERLKYLSGQLTDYLRHTQEETATLREIVKRVNLLSSASGSQPQGNTKKDRIQRTPSKAKKNKLKDHPRMVRPSLNKNKSVVDTKPILSIPTSKLSVNSDLKCATLGNVCPLTRITTTAIVPLRKPVPIESSASKPVVTLVYSRKSKAAKKEVPIVQIVLWYLDSRCSKHMTGDRSQLINFVQKFLSTVKFRNDHVAKIIGYSDYKIGNVTILKVYFVEGLGHNLFSVGQFCDSDLEVTFRQRTCFIRNLDGVDLLTGSRGNNLYTLSLQDIMASSLICLLSKASKTKF